MGTSGNINKPIFIQMVGISGSGKSYYAQELAKKYNAIIHSSDALRKEFYGDESIQDNPQKIFIELHQRIKKDLKKGKNVIMDATNLSMKRRIAFLQELKRVPCIKRAIVVLCPYNDAIIHNASRERQVPADVIKKHIKQFQIPMEFEGWDSISFADTSSKKFTFKLNELMDSCDIPHDNPHHSLSIKDHMLACHEEAQKAPVDVVVATAAKYHDIGKPFCKEFKNSKGEPCEVAHYYNHHNVSAYFFLCSMMNSFQKGKERIKRKYGDCFDKLGESLAQASVDFGFWEVVSEMTFLINYHMDPFLKSEKAYKRFEELIGEERAERLRLLHECDLAAH